MDSSTARVSSIVPPTCPWQASKLLLPPLEGYRGDGGWAKKQKTRSVFGTQPKKKPIPGRMAQMPWAGTDDTVGWFRRYRWSILINCDSNRLMRGTSLVKLISPTNNPELQERPAIWIWMQLVTLNNWSFCTPTSIFGTNELYNPVFFLLSLHPLGIPGRLGTFWESRQVATIWICEECHIQRERKRRHRDVCSRPSPSWRISRLCSLGTVTKPTLRTAPELCETFFFGAKYLYCQF